MTYKPGDRVQLPEGWNTEVLGVEDGKVRVRLDGEATGLYPPDRLTPVSVPGRIPASIRADSTVTAADLAAL